MCELSPDAVAHHAARDLLIHHHDEYDAVASTFERPAVTESFNQAINWFDQVAEGNSAWPVGDHVADSSELGAFSAHPPDRVHEAS